jgi:hypothetical protein
VLGLRMSARSQVTLCAHAGGVEEAVIEDHVGSPDRLLLLCKQVVLSKKFYFDHFLTNLIDVTSQPLATADLHIREPRKPLPPQTTIFLAVAMFTRAY